MTGPNGEYTLFSQKGSFQARPENVAEAKSEAEAEPKTEVKAEDEVEDERVAPFIESVEEAYFRDMVILDNIITRRPDVSEDEAPVVLVSETDTDAHGNPLRPDLKPYDMNDKMKSVFFTNGAEN